MKAAARRAANAAGAIAGEVLPAMMQALSNNGSKHSRLWGEEELESLSSLNRLGWSPKQIAFQLRRTEAAVEQQLRKIGAVGNGYLPFRTRTRARTGEEEIARLYGGRRYRDVRFKRMA